MKTDLDALMASKSVDAILVTGPAQHNPAMVYLTGVGHMTEADVFKKRGEPAVLFHQPMERGEAAATGLQTINYSKYPLTELTEQAGGDRVRALAMRYQRMLEELAFEGGAVALYGKTEIGQALAVFDALRELVPRLHFVPEADDSLLMEAMATKDASEVERVRRMGAITTCIVGRVADFLSGQRAKDGVLINSTGEPLTIGAIKSRINLWLAECGAENPEGTIFAIGKDSALPHSSGKASDLLRTGQTIVFDIFPCEQGGGYYYDFTRTWCLGYAPDEVIQIYTDVYEVFQKMLAAYAVGRACGEYQNLACELFESKGRPTGLHTPGTEEGYVHGLGHGVGLNIHERPWFSTARASKDVISPGAVFTLEPGLYYPERGMGVRIEDTIWANPQGGFEILAEYPYDLVLPVKGG
ncbi:MAG TPA: Xaa-Pro peptidase family protein [Anaerolineaceae bacterium]|nr:Xaa-Pro peptidase family protein [Anaerolineaceae bacterium]